MGEDLATLEARLEASRSEVVAAREILAVARSKLNAIEDRAKRSWRRRNAALESLRITKRTALACGLERSRSTTVSVNRIQTSIDNEKEEVRIIVESANSICQEFYAAWGLVRVARKEEEAALLAIIAESARHDSAAKSVLRDATVDSVVHDTAVDVVEQRRRDARRELKELERTMELEEKQRRKDFAGESDGHFDPDYDDWEILLRRVRPWV